MDPEREGYISLEEETTTSTPQHSDNPNEIVPSPPASAEDDAALSDGSSAELVETGLRNPAFMDMGLPGTTDNGVAGNLVTHRECPPKEGYQLNNRSQVAHHLLHK